MNDRSISLNAAIDALRDRYYKYDRFAKIEELVWAIEALPSAQPDVPDTNVGDNLNVDELIKFLNPESNYVFYDEAHGFCINTQDVLDHLCAMPSAQPNTCDGCMWDGAIGYGECHHCKRAYPDMYEKGELV